MNDLPRPFARNGPEPSDRTVIARTPVWTFLPPAEPVGAVLFLHHRTGLDDFTADITARLLGLGCAVTVPELFAGQPPGLAPEERKSLLRDEELLEVMAGGTRLLRRTGRDVAALGFCMGGRLAFLAAVAGTGVDRSCCFYGGALDQGWHHAVSPLERTSAGAAPVQFHRGSRDTNPDAGRLARAVQAFDEVGGYLEACTYAGAGHAFANRFAADRHHPVVAARAWDRATAFLGLAAPVEPRRQPAGAAAGRPEDPR
ncbi:dienelactone hydrolase family protein [Streptomyces sp. NPDC087270]|uniref:dienelactone hydrolase family protein n=1 Tax=Streptomyces sp. NPDC087270 TaxID=3365774 RepID=UPI00380FBB90